MKVADFKLVYSFNILRRFPNRINALSLVQTLWKIVLVVFLQNSVYTERALLLNSKSNSLQADCNVNATNYSDVTPLGLVLESKFGVDREIAYLLIQNKVSVNIYIF